MYSVREREPVKLAMQHHPFCVSYSYYEGGSIVLTDATLAEEQVRDGEVVVTLNRHGEVCQMAKFGGAPVDPLLMLKCTTLALEKVKTLHAFVQKRLDEDAMTRDKGGLIAELSAENAR